MYVNVISILTSIGQIKEELYDMLNEIKQIYQLMNMEKQMNIQYLIERSIHLQNPDFEDIENFGEDLDKAQEYFDKNNNSFGMGEVSFLKALSYYELLKRKV